MGTENTEEIKGTGRTFLALGDSYTIGQSVDRRDSWPYQLVSMLRAENVTVDDPVVIATTGWTTGDLLYALENAPPRRDFSMVSLLIGVNNQYRGESLEEYRKEYNQLLDSAILYAGGNKNRVFVLSIPDYSVTPFAAYSNPGQIAQELQEFNRVKKELTLARGILFVDITPISQQAAQKQELLASDKLHPSGLMYRQWIDLILPVILPWF